MSTVHSKNSFREKRYNHKFVVDNNFSTFKQANDIYQ